MVLNLKTQLREQGENRLVRVPAMVILSAGSFRSEQPECSWAVWAQNVIGVFGIELLRGLHPLATKPEINHGFLNRDV